MRCSTTPQACTQTSCFFPLLAAIEVLANMKFIGNLFLRQLLAAKVIGQVVHDLIGLKETLPEEHMIECVCELLQAAALTEIISAGVVNAEAGSAVTEKQPRPSPVLEWEWNKKKEVFRCLHMHPHVGAHIVFCKIKHTCCDFPLGRDVVEVDTLGREPCNWGLWWHSRSPRRGQRCGWGAQEHLWLWPFLLTFDQPEPFQHASQNPATPHSNKRCDTAGTLQDLPGTPLTFSEPSGSPGPLEETGTKGVFAHYPLGMTPYLLIVRLSLKTLPCPLPVETKKGT